MVVRTPMKDLKGYLTYDEVQKLIDSAYFLDEKVLIQLLYRTGARVSEVLGIKVGDVLSKDRIIIIKQLKKRADVSRRVPVGKEVMNLIKSYIKQRKLKGEDRLFTFTRQTAYNMLKRVGKRCGITNVGSKPLHPHHLRHSFGIHWVEKGGSLRKLQLIMGHSSIDITTQYLQFSPIDLRGEYDKVWSE